MYQTNQFGQLVDKEIKDWVSRPLPANSPLQGRYCTLVPTDIDKQAKQLFDVFAIHNQGESWTYLPYGPFDDFAAFKQWLVETKNEHGTFLYTIVDNKTQAPVGVAGYLRMTPEHGVIEIGHVHFSALLKQTPLATEAIYLMLHYAFDELGYRRCEWKCNVLNEASRMAAKRFGFTFEGVFRQHFVLKNHNRDTAWFSMLDSEWPALKMAFEKWLSPNNFDANGKQIAKLSAML